MPIKNTVDMCRLNRDLSWALMEYGSNLWLNKSIRRIAPRPDHPKPVLSLPGFRGPEFTLGPLTKFLCDLGFDAKPWGMGANKGHKGGLQHMQQLTDQLEKKIQTMASISGEKVSLIGHSLGGIYARELARNMPDYVDRVITLGTPARLDVLRSARGVNRVLYHLFRKSVGTEIKNINSQEYEQKYRDIAMPPPGVPLVSIYSPYDGIVAEYTTAIPPEYLVNGGGAPRENIEIIASHTGMIFHPMALLAIADRLLVDTDNWSTFDIQQHIPCGFQSVAKALFPEPIVGD